MVRVNALELPEINMNRFQNGAREKSVKHGVRQWLQMDSWSRTAFWNVWLTGWVMAGLMTTHQSTMKNYE